MRNERLRALLLERGQTPDKLAEAVQVDAKTVEQWITKDKTAAGVRVRILLGDPDSQVVTDRRDDEGVGDAMAAKIRNALALYRPLRAAGGRGIPVPPDRFVQLDLPRR